MIWVSDEKGQLLYVHSGWQVLTGQSPADTLGNGCWGGRPLNGIGVP